MHHVEKPTGVYVLLSVLQGREIRKDSKIYIETGCSTAYNSTRLMKKNLNNTSGRERRKTRSCIRHEKHFSTRAEMSKA